MAFNSSTYYSIQNFGTDYYVGRNGNTVQYSSSNTAWQIGACTGSESVFIRYANLCLVPQRTGPINLTSCSPSHVSWTPTFANGVDISDGWYLTNTEVNGTLSLSNNPGPPPVILMAVNPGVTEATPYFAWAFQEISQGSWPDSGPQSVNFCSGSQSSTTSTSRTLSTVTSGTRSTTSTIPSAFVSDPTSTTTSSTGSTTSSMTASSSASTTQPSTVTVTQQVPSSSTTRAATSGSESRHLTLAKSLFLGMIGLSVCMQLI